jgi:hypothetical protein
MANVDFLLTKDCVAFLLVVGTYHLEQPSFKTVRQRKREMEGTHESRTSSV